MPVSVISKRVRDSKRFAALLGPDGHDIVVQRTPVLRCEVALCEELPEDDVAHPEADGR